MAVSAFKSTSRRATSATTSTTPPLPASSSGKAAEAPRHRSGRDSVKKAVSAPVPPRRSRSVSAFSRTGLSVDSDFSNKRDNPLYWSAEADSPRLDGGDTVKIAKFDGAGSRLSGGSSKVSGVGGSVGESARGRSATRYSDPVRAKSTVGGGSSERAVGRSLSRVDTGRRRRSVSRGHYAANSESERDRGSSTLRSRSKTDSNVPRVNAGDKSGLDRSDSDLSELLKVWQTWSSEQDISGVSQWGDGGSISSFSDAEERINKPVSDVMNVMRRSCSSSTLSTDITGVELVNPAEAELAMEARGEYARKLEESQDRARKLRAELAVEEHRKVELNKILDEMIEHPETPDVKKPRAIRKASMERRKVSRRLAEEALAYFDECVSISTFDESDFSSLEDPLSNIVGSAEQHGKRMTLPSGNASVSINLSPIQSMDPSNPTLLKGTASPHSTSNSTTLESPSTSSHTSSNKSWKRQFSFAADKQKDSSTLTQELRSYAKIFTKDGAGKKSSNSRTVTRSRHYTDEYASSVPTEKFLFERVALRYRIDSGGMLLCGGSTGFPF